MTHGSLFSGIGGFDLAAEWMGWENKFHCEWNPFCQKVLHHYWPNAEQFTDITKSNFTKYVGTIDIISGGFPCQPYSSAGKRLGKEDERHLWPEMLRAIREIQPSWVVGENVRGLTNWNGGLVFDEVQADLEAIGYEVTPFLLPACAVNAPHRRDRIWFIAYSESKRRWKITSEDKGREDRHINNDVKNGDASNSDRNGFNECNSDNEVNASQRGEYAFSNIKQSNGDGDVADTKCSRLEHRNKTTNFFSKEAKALRERSQSSNDFKANGNGICNASNTNGIGLRRQSNRIGEPGFISKDYKTNNWQNFPTVPPICTRDDGFPNRLDGITFSKWRNESIKAGGNAIVPQVALQIFKAIQQYEDLNT